MRLLPLLTVLLLAFGLMACDTIIDDTIDPIDSVDDEELSSPDEANFLINGIIARSNNVQDNMSVQASLMSDQFIFGGGIGGGATFPTFRDIMRGLPPDTNPLNNNSVDGTQSHLGQYRFLADNLLRRVDDLGAEAFGGEDDALYQRTQFIGNFHGALARYYWATFFTDVPGTGASGVGVISELDVPADPNRGEPLADTELYAQAFERLDIAAGFATDYELRVINSVKARIALFQDNVAEAAAFAEDGLQPGDAPFQNSYLDRAGNQANVWHTQGGVGRVQVSADPRFAFAPGYSEEAFIISNPTDFEGDPNTFSRIPLFSAADAAEVVDAGVLFNRDATIPIRFDIGFDVGDAVPLFAQGRYINRDFPINFITWQEMNLIRAEAAERGDAGGDPVALINEVRDSHNVDPITPGNYDGMNTIFVERDKEFFTTGLRLVDQRRATRFGLDSEGLDLDVHGWHLSNDVWWYLPITLAERNNNPNLPTELP